MQARHVQGGQNLAPPANASPAHQEESTSALLCQRANKRQHLQTSNGRAEPSKAAEASEPFLQHLQSPLPDSDATPAGLEPSELPPSAEQGIAESLIVTDGEGQEAAGLGGYHLDSTTCDQAGPLCNKKIIAQGEGRDTRQGQEGCRSSDADRPPEGTAMPCTAPAGVRPSSGETSTPLRPAQHGVGKRSSLATASTLSLYCCFASLLLHTKLLQEIWV